MISIPKIVVLLVGRNSVVWIGEQFDTVWNQKKIAVTIFLSINRLINHAEKICIKYLKIYNKIIVSNANKCGGAKNFFKLVRDVDSSAFDYVSLSDQNDIWHGGELARAVAQIEQHQLGGYYSNAKAFWPQGEQSVIARSLPQRQWDCMFEAASPGCTHVFSVALTAALKLSITKNYLQINELGLHDWYSYAFARASGYRWLVGTQPSWQHRQHSSNQVGASN